MLRLALAFGLLGLMTVGVGCRGQSCGDVNYVCGITDLFLVTPDEQWTAGAYGVALDVNGATTRCTLDFPADAGTTAITGSCSGTPSFGIAMEPVPTCPPVACNGGVCGSQSCTPVAGQFQMVLETSQLPTTIGVSLTRDGTTLFDQTITPAVQTSEPNGEGCGTCTRESAKIALDGG